VNVLDLLTWMSVFMTAGLSAVVFVRRPPAPLWPSLFFVMFSAFVWCLGELLTMSFKLDEATYWRMLAVEYTGVLLVPPTWWIFGLRFAEVHGLRLPERFEAARTAPLALAGVFWLAMVTNPWHGQFLSPHLHARNGFEPVWYAQATVGYVLLLTVIGLFAWMFRRAQDPTLREQLAILVAASLVPMTCNFLYVTGLVDVDGGLTAGGLGVSMLLFFTGIYRDRLFSLSSISMSHLIANEPDGMLLLDRQGRLLHFNPAATQLMSGVQLVPNADAFELLSRVLRDGDAASSAAEIERAVMSTDAGPFGVVRRLEGDADRWVEIHVIPISNRGGRHLGTGLRLRDVSALREARDQLRAQAAVLEAILGSAEQGMLVLDSTGRTIYSNRAFRDLWQITEDDLSGGDDAALIEHIASRLEEPQLFLDELSPGRGRPLETTREELRLVDGRIVERSSRSLRLDGGKGGRVWSFFDVTAEREAERERQQLETQMLQAQKLESLGILAGGIAHDFNNLLAGILGNADLVLKLAAPDSEMREPLLDIVEASRRAAELTNQMLAYSGRSRFVVGAIDLRRLTEETRQLLSAVITKNARVELDLDPVPLIEGDPTQLRQVVMNLITNASDALESTGGTIRVSTRVVEVTADQLAEHQLGDDLEPGRFVSLEVSDTGAGMDPATTARIFDPFFTTKFTGRGLGLSAVLGIVRAHHGAIRVESKAGHGTSIRLLLPPSRSAGEAKERAAETSPREDAWRGRGSVLVADDEPAVLRLLKRILTATGFDVVTASSGPEALTRFGEHADEVVAVLLDMTMPGHGGLETLARLREAGASVPIILTSGYAQIGARDELEQELANAFIQKPFAAADLVAILRTEIERSGRDR